MHSPPISKHLASYRMTVRWIPSSATYVNVLELPDAALESFHLDRYPAKRRRQVIRARRSRRRRCSRDVTGCPGDVTGTAAGRQPARWWRHDGGRWGRGGQQTKYSREDKQCSCRSYITRNIDITVMSTVMRVCAIIIFIRHQGRNSTQNTRE